MKINDILSEAKIEPGERRELILSLQDRKDKINNYFQQHRDTMSPDEFQRLKDKMMKLSQKIQDLGDDAFSINNDKLNKMHRLFGQLDKKCSQIMNVYRQEGQYLYRAINTNNDIFYSTPRVNRKPLDSNKDYHNLVIRLMKELGIEARRDNSTFCIGSRNVAKRFGNHVYVIIPFDGFSFAWSEESTDMILNHFTMSKMIDVDIIAPLVKYIFENERAHRYFINNMPFNMAGMSYDDMMYRFKTSTSYLSDFLETVQQGETFRGEQLLPKELHQLTRFENIVTARSMQAALQFSTTDLNDAIQSGNEVYVSGEFYALNDDYAWALTEYLETTKKG